MAPHVHFWRDRPYEDGIVIEECHCGAVRFGITDWGAADINHPDWAVKEPLARAAELNRTLGKEGHEMPAGRRKRVVELPDGFSPRPVIPDGTNLWNRNQIVGKWYDENRAAITEIFEKDSYAGLKKVGISLTTAKGLFKKWEKADGRSRTAGLQAGLPVEPSQPPAPDTPPAPPGSQIEAGVCAWPAYSTLGSSVEERSKWIEKTAELALAGKVILK